MSKNGSLALNLLAMAAGMLMLAYASVPLYRLFCEMTGYGGTPRQAERAPAHALERKLTVSFNADIDPHLAWEFKPGQHTSTIKIGEQALAFYTAENLTAKPIKGRATYNVVPFAAAPYFVKIDCFCFTEQTLPANTKVNMPISYYIDPAIVDDPDMKNVKTITLSYTFFAVKE